MHQLVNPSKALRTLRKTPLLLDHLLNGLSQAEAEQLRDGLDGWNILYIVCHLRDIETLFSDRVRLLLEQPGATFTVITNEELMAQNNYDAQDLHAVLAAYHERRTAFIALLETLNDAQWAIGGVHPLQGPATILDVAINTGLHDIDHLEQIMRCRFNPGA